MAKEDSGEPSFQKLLFLVRDWQNPYEVRIWKKRPFPQFKFELFWIIISIFYILKKYQYFTVYECKRNWLVCLISLQPANYVKGSV